MGEGRLMPKEKFEDTKRVIKRRSRKSKDRRCTCKVKEDKKIKSKKNAQKTKD